MGMRPAGSGRTGPVREVCQTRRRNPWRVVLRSQAGLRGDVFEAALVLVS